MNGRLTRQELLRRGAAGGTLLAFPSLLAACGGGGGGDAGGGEVLDVLNFSNWQLYIDTAKPTTLEKFKEQEGITVNYFEDINDNAQYFAKVQGPLSQGQGIGRDIFVFTDNSRFPGLLVDQGWVQKLDKSLIPNMSNLIAAQASPSFDPNRDYSLPWFSGITGIAWNSKLTGPIRTMEQFFTDPKLKNKATMLMELADSVGLTMLGNGDDPSTVTPETYESAIGTIKSAVDSGQIQKFTGNDYAQPLARGELAAAVAWSGDVIQLIADNPHLRWDIPESGGMIWTDNMLIPVGGSVPTASTYMNYVYDPAIAAQLAVGAGYISSVDGVQAEAEKIDPKAAANPLLFPTPETLSKVHQYDSAALNNDEYITTWQGVLGQ
ncbi:MAG: spermidine/putrescine transporter substrate-binding protein [Thermoleophilia bacterium]|nr:spermidine/putrescine transporter substrate-binding protein [Thermoleophilia bacterium]